MDNPRKALLGLATTEGSTPSITNQRFTGNNYLQWSQGALMFIIGKGKEEYLTGEATERSSSDPKYRQWRAETNMVKSWLFNSLSPKIAETFLLLKTAHDVWEAMKRSYPAVENTVALLQIKGFIRDFKQGDLNVTEYYNTLLKFWHQLDMFEVYHWKYDDDALTFRKIVEKERIYTLLLGLNSTLDEVRGRIMSTRQLPSLDAVFAGKRVENTSSKRPRKQSQ